MKNVAWNNRRRTLRVEPLENRLLLNAGPASGGASTAFMEWNGQEVEVCPGRWVVALDDFSSKAADHMETFQSLIDDAWGKAQVEAEAGDSRLSELNGLDPDAYAEVDRWLHADGVYSIRLPQSLSAAAAVDFAEVLPGYQYIEPVVVLTPCCQTNDEHLGIQWMLNSTGQLSGDTDNPRHGGLPGADISAFDAWDTTMGSSDVVVAVIDSGVDMDHVDLISNIWTNPNEIPDNGLDDDGNGFVDDVHGWDFGDNDADPNPPENPSVELARYHGTHVAGIIGACGNNSIGVAGVCPNVRILPLKGYSDATNQMDSATVANAINYVTSLARDFQIDVVATNLSWGGSSGLQTLADPIEYQREAGILFITAAGNDSKDLSTGYDFYPAEFDHDNIISVAGSNRFDELAWFSNWGTEDVDLAAPGFEILSTLPDDEYGLSSGTSMAAPVVAGAAALIRTVAPTATYAQIKDYLLTTLDPMPSLEATGREFLNNGRLNLGRAVERAVFASPDDNGPPDAEKMVFTANEGGSISGNTVASDPDLDALTYSLVDDFTNGNLVFSSNGQFTYTPDAQAGAGCEVFTYRAHDGALYSETVSVSLVFEGEDTEDWEETYSQLPVNWNDDRDFGSAIAIENEFMVVSAPNAEDWPGTERIRLFENVEGMGWFIKATFSLPGSDLGHTVCGYSLAIDDSVLVVGCPDVLAAEAYPASIVVFEKSSGTSDWSSYSADVLNAPANSESLLFGSSIAIDGDTIVVGAPDALEPPSGGGDPLKTGAVFVYENGANGWELASTLYGTAENDEFGSSVAISGDTIIIGGKGTQNGKGAAYVCTRSGTQWTTQLAAVGGNAGDQLGFCVAIDEEIAVAGAPGENQSVGAAHVFWKEGSTWSTSQHGILTPTDGAGGDTFASSVAIEENRIVMGAPGTNEDEGAAYVFDSEERTWSTVLSNSSFSPHEFKLVGSVCQSGDRFAQAVTVNGNRIVAGAPGYLEFAEGAETRHRGIVYVFEPTFEGCHEDVHKNTTIENRYLMGSPVTNSNLTFSLVSASPNVTLENAQTGEFTYTPPTDFTGEDSFMFEMTDGGRFKQLGTVNLSVVPRVTEVSLANSDSTWTADSSQWAGSNMRWAGVDRIVIEFDEPISADSVSQQNVSVASTTGSLAIDALTVSETDRTLTIALDGVTLSGEDVFTITLGDTITDVHGNPIDGELIFGTFPSGDGVAGGDWVFSISVLTGDANGDGYVAGGDLDIVRANWGAQVTPGNLSVGDIYPDGTVGTSDLDAVRANWGAGTPPERAAETGGSGSESSVRIETVDNRSAKSLNRYITQDILFAVVENWLSAELKLDLTRGNLYQDRYGDDTTPNAALLEDRRSLEYDTYLSGGSADASVTIFGGAVDLGGSSEFIMDNDEINATWFSTTKTDAKALQLARLTLSADAIGTWSMRISDEAGNASIVHGTVSNGILVVGF